MSKILNLGAGEDTYGDVRVDFIKTKTTTHVCDLNNPLPFCDGEFSIVYCNSVLEHIRNVGILISEIYKLLKVGGSFIIRTDNASYIPFHLRNHQDYINYSFASKDDKHYYLFKEEHLRNLFSKFSNIVIKYAGKNKKLFFLPDKFSCMHIEIYGVKK